MKDFPYRVISEENMAPLVFYIYQGCHHSWILFSSFILLRDSEWYNRPPKRAPITFSHYVSNCYNSTTISSSVPPGGNQEEVHAASSSACFLHHPPSVESEPPENKHRGNVMFCVLIFSRFHLGHTNFE